MNIEWLHAFELGVPEIDNDHRTIVDLMKAVETSLAAGQVKRAMSFLDRLVEFSANHFQHEEALLISWKYPDATTHSQYHQGILDTVDRIKETCIRKKGNENFKDCINEMMRYLIDDVIKGDMRLKSFLQHTDLVISS